MKQAVSEIKTTNKHTSSGPFFGNSVFPKLTVNQPNDRYEQEADAMADRVMQMDSGQVQTGPANQSVQRKCTDCHEEEAQRMPLMRQVDGNAGLEVSVGFSQELNNSKGGGSHLPASTQQRMGQAFGTDFSNVRVHAGNRAAEMSQGIQAKAFTHGSDIYFNRGQYQPGSSGGDHLLAHELTHVVQQGGAKSNIQRLAMTPSCSGREPAIRAAETQGKEMTRATIGTLEAMRSAMSYEGGPAALMPTQTTFLWNTFGDVGGLEGGGGFTRIGTIIERYERILAGFDNRNARCDVNTVPNNDCEWRSAFVVVGNRDDIFLCPNFFDEDRGEEGERNAEVAPIQRGQTLIHELAHSVFNATHAGLPERTFPGIMFDCGADFELGYDSAIRNAFAYGILANCLHGTSPGGVHSSSTQEEARDARAQQEGGNYGGVGAGIGAALGAIGGGIGGYFAGQALAGSIGTAGAIGAGIGIGVLGAGLGALAGWGIGSLFSRDNEE